MASKSPPHKERSSVCALQRGFAALAGLLMSGGDLVLGCRTAQSPILYYTRSAYPQHVPRGGDMGRHLTAEEILTLLVLGKAQPSTIEKLLEHLLGSCEICRERTETVSALLAGIAVSDNPRGHVVANMRSRALLLRKLQVVGGVEFRELMALSPEKRRQRINRAFTRFRNPALVDLVVEESKRVVVQDPFDAVALAECAHDLALRLSIDELGRTWVMTCVARANAHIGNTLRATGDLKRAEQVLSLALSMFDEDGNGDPLVEAELMGLLGSLKSDQRKFVAAESYLNMAEGIYDACEEPILSARVLVKKGVVLFDSCEPERAIAAVTQALQVLSPLSDQRLYLTAKHNLTDYLQEVGRYSDAWRSMEDLAPLYDQYPDNWTQNRRAWVAGKIARGLGDRPKAETLFSGVRSSFMAEGLGLHAALAGLDLARLYVEDGKREEVKRLVEEMTPIFAAQDCHREAATATRLLQEVAQS